MIVFFGDHLPPLNQGYTETGFLKEPVPERREPPEALALHRETPLVVWSNKTGPMKDIGSISPSLHPAEAASRRPASSTPTTPASSAAWTPNMT